MGSHASQRFIGLELDHRYTLTEALAEGECALVLRGEDTVLRRPVAVKVVPAEMGEVYRAALRQAGSLSHPAMIATYDVLEHEDVLCLVQEYVPAYPLTSYLRQGVPTERALALGMQMLHAIAYAHRHGVVHGDLVPSSVLVDRRAVVRINNVGLPRRAHYFDAVLASLGASADSLCVGEQTPQDFSSEIEQLAAERSMAADVWAVGVLVWRLLSEVPGATGNEGRPRQSLIESDARTFRPDVPSEVRLLVARWLAGQAGDADTLALGLTQIGEELAQERGEGEILTPPALRAAREVASRNAAWAVSETLSGPRLWQGQGQAQWQSAGISSSLAENVAPTDPMTRSENGGSSPFRDMPASVPSYDGTIDQRRLFPLATAELTPQWGAPAALVTGTPGATTTPATATLRRRRLGIGSVFVLGVVLFVLFFLVGYFGPLLFGIR